MKFLVALGVGLWLHFSAPPLYAWDHWPGEWSPARPRLAVGSETTQGSSGEAAALIQAPAFRLEVPFRTQKDGGVWQTSNCGPASLGMILDGFGIHGQSTDDLRFRAHTYQGTVGMRTGTALQHLARVAEDFGVPTTGLYDDSAGFRSWSLEDIRGQLRRGRPVIPLVRLYLLPGREASAPRWGHYILLTGVSAEGFYYNDSLQPEPAAGMSGWISAQQLERAMQASHIPGQALAFGGPGVGSLQASIP